MTCATVTKEKTADFCQDQDASYAHEAIGGQDFVKLPGGQVVLGDEHALNNPVHQAHIDPFLVATTEVTNAQMDAYIADQGTKTYALIGVDAQHQVHILARGTEAEVKAMNPQVAENAANLHCGALMYTDAVEVVPPADRLQGLSAKFAASDHPVVLVSWYDAIGYTNYMSEKTGREFRLLTEDEWEYAAMGGKDLKYATTTGGLFFDYRKLAQVDARVTAAVGQTRGSKNPYGIFDMTGNVEEWTLSVQYPDLPYRVSRGGSWKLSSWEDNLSPQTLDLRYSGDGSPSSKSDDQGFRVAVSVSSPKGMNGAHPSQPQCTLF